MAVLVLRHSHILAAVVAAQYHTLRLVVPELLQAGVQEVQTPAVPTVYPEELAVPVPA